MIFSQVGNEINDGLLWPVGRISVNGYSPASQLLHSAINGAKAAGTPKIMIHLANGWDWSMQQSWYSNIFIQGALATTDVDILGVSYYPFYNTAAKLSTLSTSLTNLANLMRGKQIVVAETDWPATCSGVSLSASIAVSAAGQNTWIGDVRKVLAALPNNAGAGICKIYKNVSRYDFSYPVSLLGTWLDWKCRSRFSVFREFGNLN